MQVQLEVADLAGTERFGRNLGRLLFPGAAIGLIGPLGAGKTHLTRAIAEGLDVLHPEAVCSPTFVLIHEYQARLPIYHFDVYRLSSSKEFVELGTDEYFRSDGVCIIEWADKVPDAMPTERLQITIEMVDANRRRLVLSAIGGPYRELLNKLSASA